MKVTRKIRGVASSSLVAIAFSAAMSLGGCATAGSVGLDGVAERSANARTESDHRELAAIFEQQADRDKESSEQHRRLAQSYAKSWSPAAPWSHATGKGPAGNPALVKHCENLKSLYAQASAANLALAAAHRQASIDAAR